MHNVSSMKRRALLGSALAVAAGGCLSRADTAPPTTEKRLFSVGESTVDPPSDVQLVAECRRHQDRNSPANVRVALKNEGTTDRSVSSGPSPPFDPSIGHQSDSDARLLLVPSDGTGFAPSPAALQEEPEQEILDQRPVVPDEATDGCWRANYGNLLVYSMARGGTLAAGESMERDYVLLAHPANEGCVPPGTYRFNDSAEIDGQSVELAVTIDVSA